MSKSRQSESKKVFKGIILDALEELADRDYQRRVWVEGSTIEISSMNEAVAALFDDSGLDEALEKNDVTFTPEIDQEFKQLRIMLRSCLERLSCQTTQDLIGTPEWAGILGKTARLKKLLTNTT